MPSAFRIPAVLPGIQTGLHQQCDGKLLYVSIPVGQTSNPVFLDSLHYGRMMDGQ